MPNLEKLKALRREYSKRAMDESSVESDPFVQFKIWFDEVSAVSTAEINAMALATADATGRPSVRMVLLKDFDSSEFSFFTNYQSRKGLELDANPNASLLFYWSDLERQVKIEGTVERLSRERNEEYFNSRPRGAQLGALVSAQSRALSSRRDLEEQLSGAEHRFAQKPVPCPEHWGGYRLLPSLYEFWQGRENRLHDRICYQRSAQSIWNISRLYP